MGGHAAGEVASAHAVRALATAAPRDAAAIEAALRQVDSDLLAMGEVDPARYGMGTTVAGALVDGGGWLRFGAGDSRVYREHGGYLAQVSVDDSGPTGGLTQCLGGRARGIELRVDVEQMPAAGRLLLCSDGLSDLVELEAMEALLAAPGGSARAVKALWAAAMNESGRDNITIALVELVGDPAAAPRPERAGAGQGAPT
jgi:serine/threonine protein phosphatase PrpC